MLFTSTALAADTATSAVAGAAPTLGGALPMLLIIIVFYFLIIRPNQKKIRDHEEMTKALRRGDKVVTAGGVIGVISKVEDDNILVLEIAENVKVRVLRGTISEVVNKNIANDNKAEEKLAEKANKK